MAEGSRRGNRYVIRSRRQFVTGAVAAVAGLTATGAPAALAAGPKSFIRGAMTTFVFRKRRPHVPDLVPDLKFRDRDDAERAITEWRGRVVLINLWATWCAPCRKEMPSLDRLQSGLGGADFEVVAVSIDRKGLKASGAFLKEIGASNLELYVDKSGKVARDLKSFGLPASVLIGRNGEEIGRLIGPAEWDSGEAVALVEAAVAGRFGATS